MITRSVIKNTHTHRTQYKMQKHGYETPIVWQVAQTARNAVQ